MEFEPEQFMKYKSQTLILSITGKKYTFLSKQGQYCCYQTGSTDTAWKIYHKHFDLDWVNNWQQLFAFVEALSRKGIYLEIEYKVEKEIGCIYIELPYSEKICESSEFIKVIMIDGHFIWIITVFSPYEQRTLFI